MSRENPGRPISIRVEPDQLARIDAARGEKTRTAWMASAFNLKLNSTTVPLGGPSPRADPTSESAKRADADQRRVQAEKITRVPGTNIIRTGSPSLARGLQARPKASAKGKSS